MAWLQSARVSEYFETLSIVCEHGGPIELVFVDLARQGNAGSELINWALVLNTP